MSENGNQNDTLLYEGTEPLFGDTAAGKDGSLVEYEIYTMDEHGKETIDKMSEEEAVQTIKEISVHYGDHAVVEFSDDGGTALIESEKEEFDEELFEEQVLIHKVQKMSFEEEIKHCESANELPAYSGIYDTDKAIAAVVEENSKEEQAFVYDIIRRNFLIKHNFFFTEEERQANVSLGMKKAEYAAKHFIAGENQSVFLKEMELIAKLASAGTADSNGKMDYGVKKGSYLGHGKNLVDTANPVDMMRRMDITAYQEYQKICMESSSEDKLFYALKYLSNWYLHKVLRDPFALENYKKQTEEYMEKKVKSRRLDTTFAAVRITRKEDFLEDLRLFQSNRPDFLASVIEKELSLEFWTESVVL